jgi:hypothetical protein
MALATMAGALFFAVGGTAPANCLPLAWSLLPASIDYLAYRQSKRQDANAGAKVLHATPVAARPFRPVDFSFCHPVDLRAAAPGGLGANGVGTLCRSFHDQPSKM